MTWDGQLRVQTIPKKSGHAEGFPVVEARHVTVKMLLLIYDRLDGRALRVGNTISSSASCQAFYSSLRKVHEHSIANCLSIISSALVVRVVPRATHPCSELSFVSGSVG